MAVSNTSILPFKVNNVPDRFTLVYVADPTVMTTTAAGTHAVKRLTRLQGGTFRMATAVTEVTEMGATFRPGGITDLGELAWNLSWNSVSIDNAAAIAGKAVATAPGATTTIGQSDFNGSTVDFIRMVSDSKGNVFGTLYAQDAITLTYGPDARERAAVTEAASGNGPSGLFFPGFIIPKVYVATAGDASAGYLSLGGLFSTSEKPVQVNIPNAGQASNYWIENGSNYFLKIEKVPGANISNAPTRYHEKNVGFFSAAVSAGTVWITPNVFLPTINSVGQQITLGLGTANQETVSILQIAGAVNTTSGTAVSAAGAATITPASMQGIFVGVSLIADAGNSNQETVTVTAVTGTTFTATFANTHAVGFTITTPGPSYQVNAGRSHAADDPINAALSGAVNLQGTAAYIATNNRLYVGDTIVAGDAYRLVFMSYNTDQTSTSLPVSVPTNSPDTTHRAGVHTRYVPLTINGLGTNRVTSARFTMTLRREHTNGLGEKTIAYGTSSVPDVAADFDVRETDLSLLAGLATGNMNLSALGGGIAQDFADLNAITNIELQKAIPASITLYDPLNASRVLLQWSIPQFVMRDIDYSSTSRGDNTVRITGLDIQGNLTVTQTNPL